ncbi:MAG: hypothetical protein AAF552_12300 [Pseudomonadota bacterium]
MKRSHRLSIYWLSGGLLLSGLMWLYGFYFVRVVDQFGFENPHPAQKWLLVAHALFALPTVWLLGFLWHIHIKSGWQKKLKRWTGGTLCALALWMALSGYTLYYVGSDTVRSWLSWSHWIAGLVALVVLLIHIWQSRALEFKEGSASGE